MRPNLRAYPRVLLFTAVKTLARRLGGGAFAHSRGGQLLRRFAFSITRPVSASIDGHTIYLDANDTLELGTLRPFEPLETALFKRAVMPGSVVVDLGANIGYYTLLAARGAGASGRVFAFEPAPDNLRLLRRNLAVNGYSNVTVVPKAVAAESGRARLYLSERNLGDHRIYDSQDGRPSVDVPQVSLDEFFGEAGGAVDVVKMDIQGAEPGALRGMRAVLERSRELVLFTEVWPHGMTRFGGDPRAFLEELAAQGFRGFDVSEAKGRVRRVELAKMSLAEFGPEDYTTLMCVRGAVRGWEPGLVQGY